MSTRRSAELLAANEQMNLGDCLQHQRPFEAYSQQSKRVVCPSCAMFGNSVGHSLLTPKQASIFLREEIDAVNKAGKLNPEYAGRVLQDIRDTKLRAQQLQETVTNHIEEKFTKLIRALKKRKDQLTDAVFDHFEEELQKIQQEQYRWEQKEEVGRRLLQVAGSEDDQALVRSSFDVLSWIDMLNEVIDFKTFNLISGTEMGIDNEKSLEFGDLLAALEKLGSFGDHKQIQFRS